MQKENKFFPRSPGLVIAAVLLLLSEMAFIGLLMGLDVLPTVFNIVIIVLLIVIYVVLYGLLRSRKEVTRRRKVGTILSIIMIVLLGIGSFYMFTTYAAFNNMSDADKQYEDFHVVVIKGSHYHDIKDIDGKLVTTYKSNSKTYLAAQSMLKDEVDVTYAPQDSYMNLKAVLIDDKGDKHDEIIFLSSNNYSMLCEDFDGFEKSTKILYTVSVDIDSDDIAKRVGITNEPFNVYISGIDTYGGISKVSRSDVNMIMTVNPVTKEILLTSIPRDAYVTLHSYGALDKLTHSGIYGIGETVSTVEDWLDIDINYYIRVNFTSLKDVVDAIGGVDVESDHAFKSAVSKYSYVKGTNHLDGEAALYFARERKAFEGGDQQRVLNQQKVLKAILEKITGSTAILTGYTQILNSVGDEVQTNMTQKDISSLVKMQLEDLGGWTITTNAITGSGTTATTYSMGNRPLYVFIPDELSVKHAQDEISRTMNGM